MFICSKMKQHIDSMHTSIQSLETCTEKVTDISSEINGILAPNRQHMARTSIKYELLRKVRVVVIIENDKVIITEFY